MAVAAYASVAGETIPSKGRVGMGLFISFEAIFFCTFVLAYLFYVGKSVAGPQPHDVLGVGLVIFNSICLLSSSATIALALRQLRQGNMGAFRTWWLATIGLGLVFIIGTGFEWQNLIYNDGLTIRTNLFGTTFYSLVGFHAAHVIIGLGMLSIVFVLALLGHVTMTDAERVDVVSLYWHFVDAVWVVVFTSVYIIGR